ncbi:MAG: pyridoxal phosphate-dependent aminotransferase [Candidatus Marsarchaeota archaeon]|nr:pyridoxal phosphate-dependent aminotransferase [Candidatus Marsarchaeota archaeon]
MKIGEFRLADWLQVYKPSVTYNLSSSGLDEPNLAEMGVDTSYSSFERVTTSVEELLKEELSKAYGVPQRRILITIGGSEAIFITYYYIAATGGKAAVPLPNYEPMIQVPGMLGIYMAGRSTKSLVWACLTDSNNPTGKRLSGRDWDQLVEEYDASRIYVDETFSEFGFGAPSNRPSHVEAVVSSTMTKFYGLNSLRVGWIVAPEEDVDGLVSVKKLLSNQNPRFSMWIALQALRLKHRFTARAKAIVQRNSKLIHEFLDTTPDITWSEPDSAPFGLISYKRGPSSLKLCRDAAEKAKILIAPAEFFGGEKGFRLCFTTSKEEEFSLGLNALSKFLRAELENG